MNGIVDLTRRYQCSECHDWFDGDGPEGIVPHLISVHPLSHRAAAILDEVARRP